MFHILIVFISLFSIQSFSSPARTWTYKCYSYYWNGYNEKGTLLLSVSHQSATAKIEQDKEIWHNGIGGLRNLNYRSRGSIEMYKYGNNLIVEKSLTVGGRQLNDGTMGGFVRWEGQAEGGFYQYKFICKK